MKNKFIISVILAALFAGATCNAIEDDVVNKLKSKLSEFTERVKEGGSSETKEENKDEVEKEVKEEKNSTDETTAQDNTDKSDSSEENENSLKTKLSNFFKNAKSRVTE